MFYRYSTKQNNLFNDEEWTIFHYVDFQFGGVHNITVSVSIKRRFHFRECWWKMLALFVYWFDAYDIILSLARPDTKNLIFGAILLTFSINWWGEEDIFPSSYGLLRLCQTIIKVLLTYSCSNKSFKRMGWGWYEED